MYVMNYVITFMVTPVPRGIWVTFNVTLLCDLNPGVLDPGYALDNRSVFIILSHRF